MSEVQLKIADNGTKYYVNEQGKYHSESYEQPAIESPCGSKFFYKDGELHRDKDLPAAIFRDGTKYYAQFGQFHRDGDLPAAIYADGSKCYYKHGKRHRETGPAMELTDGNKKYYYINGELLSEKNFEIWRHSNKK